MKNSKIIISNPCNKDWSKMSSTENGRYCISCNKTVIDFSNWEMEEIKKLLKDAKKNVARCEPLKVAFATCTNFRILLR